VVAVAKVLQVGMPYLQLQVQLVLVEQGLILLFTTYKVLSSPEAEVEEYLVLLQEDLVVQAVEVLEELELQLQVTVQLILEAEVEVEEMLPVLVQPEAQV
jgi:hypothetical protein